MVEETAIRVQINAAKLAGQGMPASIAVSYDLKSKMHHTEQMIDD